MIARKNITTGPIIQFIINDKVNNRLFWKTLPISSYLTRASGGYIIRISPMAIGIDVVPTCIFVIIWVMNEWKEETYTNTYKNSNENP